jgi:tetratricopeptide (TPR) repeat protein
MSRRERGTRRRPGLRGLGSARWRRLGRWGRRVAALGLLPLALALAGPGLPAARAAEAASLMRLLERKACPGCRLQDADLVLADLRDADLRQAQLQRANLSQAQLDGARLVGADLSFTSLQGASLRGADLRGARLEGTDLRQSDLRGALLDPGAIGRAHWRQAQGLAAEALSYNQLHNAGVEAFDAGNWPEAERLFGEALRQRPEAKITWVARAISRGQQNKAAEAAADFGYAAALYEQEGDSANANELRQAAKEMSQPRTQPKSGNGIGGQILSGLASLLPLAVQLLPKAF